MKKIFYLLSISMLLLQGCSSDSGSNENVNNDLLVKKIVFNSDVLNNFNFSRNFTYDGNKIKRILDSSNIDNSETIYTYNNDLITSIVYNHTETGQPPSTIVATLEYDNSQRLIKVTELINGSNHEKYLYSYNNDGSVTRNIYIGNNLNQLVETSNIILNSNNDIIRESYGNTIDNYSYDTKNNPFKNILGYKKIHLYESFSNLGVYHNVIKHNTNESGNFIDTIFNYTYNSLNYPLTLASNNFTATFEYYN
jgi:hypothetical protein